jgi:hypothetical protein
MDGNPVASVYSTVYPIQRKPMSTNNLLLVLTFISVASAQTTWNGLHLKMNEDDAKKQMAAQGFELSTVEGGEGHYTATPHYELKLPDLVISLPFRPELNFDTSGLNIITLSLDTPKMIADSKSKLDALSATLITAKSIHDALVTKYGKPIDQSGACNEVTFTMLYRSRETVECHTKWRGDAQLVSVTWYFDKGQDKLFYFIQYQAQASGL